MRSVFPEGARRAAAAPTRALLIALLLGVMLPAIAHAQGAAVAAEEADPALQGGATLIRRAARLWGLGRKDDAMFWFYAGELRVHAAQAAHHPQVLALSPQLSGQMDTLGQAVREYGQSDASRLIATIDRVLAWDDANPDPALSAEAARQGRADLLALRDKARAEAAQTRRGGPTRPPDNPPPRAPTPM